MVYLLPSRRLQGSVVGRPPGQNLQLGAQAINLPAGRIKPSPKTTTPRGSQNPAEGCVQSAYAVCTGGRNRFLIRTPRRGYVSCAIIICSIPLPCPTNGHCRFIFQYNNRHFSSQTLVKFSTPLTPPAVGGAGPLPVKFPGSVKKNRRPPFYCAGGIRGFAQI